MIVNFTIQNFYALKDKVKLSFEATNSKDLEEYYLIETGIKNLRLLKLGLIYGANASGKTTILKALNFLRSVVIDPFNTKSQTFELLPFLFDPNTPKKNTFFELEFIQNKIKYLYELELNSFAVIQEKLYVFNPKKALVYSRNTNPEKQTSSIEFGSKLSISKELKKVLEANTLWNNTVLGGFLKTNIEIKELLEVSNWFGEVLNPVIDIHTNLYRYIINKIDNNELRKNKITEILHNADFNISDIVLKEQEVVLPQDFISFLKHELAPEEIFTKIIKDGKVKEKRIFFKRKIDGVDYELDYENESAGTQRYFGFSGLLEMTVNQNVVFAIDEIESSLHPDLIKHFLLTFLVNSKTSQIIATTHYRELLLEKDIIRNDSIWFTEKKANGGTDLYSIADFDSKVIRNTTSIYNAYKIGKFGARPNQLDYNISSEE